MATKKVYREIDFMFKKAIIALSIAAVSAASAVAQAQPVDDYKKVEFFAGYSNGQVDTGVDSGNSAVDFFRDRENFNGVNVSGVYNFSRYLGVKGDVSATFNNNTFSGETGGAVVSFKNNNSLYNFLGGIQVKDNANEGVFKPFGHVLVGVAHARAKFKDYTCTPTTGVCPTVIAPDSTFSDTGFAAAVGGGIDFRVNNRFQIRAIQIDWNPVRSQGTQNNLRLGAGIVF
jgi:opacity protein-like surface antigen